MKIFCEICRKNTVSNRSCKKCGEMICSVCGNLQPEIIKLTVGDLFKNRTKSVGRERLYMAIMTEVKPDPALPQSLPPPAMGDESSNQSNEWAVPGVCGRCIEQPGK